MRWCDIQSGDVVLSSDYYFVVDVYLGPVRGERTWLRLMTGMLIPATEMADEDLLDSKVIVIRGDKQVHP